MAQAVAALSGTWDRAEGRPIGIGFLLGSRRYRASVTSLPWGRSYRVVAAVSTAADDGYGVFDCEIWDGDQRVADAALTVFRPPDLVRYLKESLA
jgi:predicted hotdog family 3-hydroxylacyl-ACP dehydratase